MRARTGDNDRRAKSFGRAALVRGTGEAAPAITDHKSEIEVATPVPRTSAARPNDLARLSLSPVRARIQLGWSPFTSLKDGLATLR